MEAKELKGWANSLPDDAKIHVFSSPIMSIPLEEPYLHAVDRKSIKQPVPGMLAGKVISSLNWKKQR